MATTIPEQPEMKKPRLVKTKIVACYFLFLWLLGLLWSVTVFLSQLPLMQNVIMKYIFMILMFLCMTLGGGFAMLMMKPSWFYVVVAFQPVFPILFLIFRSSWLQFMGMIYHLAVVGFMIVVAYACFYYYWHFDEIERNDNPGILEIFALFQGGMSISNAMIFIAFTVMLYFDVRKQKKWDLMSGKLIK